MSEINDRGLSDDASVPSNNPMIMDSGILEGDDLGAPEPQGPQGRLISGVISRGHWDGVGQAARFDGMVCATLSGDGAHLYITDAFSGTVRSVDLETDEVSTLSGFPYEFAVFDGPVTQARFESPRGCGASPTHDGLLVADSATLRWIDRAESTVTTLVGRAGDTGDRDGSSSEARLGYLTHDLIWDPSGTFALLSDRSNDRIRIFSKQTQALYALSPLMEGGRELTLNGPGGLAFTETGDLLVADTFNGRLVRVNMNALELEQRLGAQMSDEQPLDLELGDIEAEVVSEGLPDPQGVATAEGRAWVAGFGGEITEIDLMTGESSPLSFDLSVHKEPPLGGAFAPLLFDHFRSVLYYLDINSESVRQIDPVTGIVKTIAGPKDATGDRDGALDIARFGVLYDVVGTDRGWIVADPTYGKVRQVITEGENMGVMTLISAQSDTQPLSPPTERSVGQAPVALAYDARDTVLYIADIREHVIRRYNLDTQEIEVVVGAVGESGDRDGTGVEARLNEPFGLDFGPDRILYIADVSNRAIRSFDPETREVNTLATGEVEPFDVLKHSDGELYVVDGSIPVIFKVIQGQFTPVIGNAQEAGPGDGEEGRLASPIALTRYLDDKILVVDAENHRIRIADLERGTLDTWLGQFTRRGGWGTREPLPWEEIRLLSPNAVAQYADTYLVLSDAGLILLEGDPHILEASPDASLSE